METIITLEFGGNKFAAHYPNVGEKMKIEQLKLILSENTYANLVAADTVQGNYLLDFIDAFSYLSVCCPEMKLDVKQFKDYNVKIEKTITLLFKKFFFPWYIQIEEAVMTALTEDTESIAKQDKKESAE